MVQPTLSSTLGPAETGSTKMETIPSSLNMHRMPHPYPGQYLQFSKERDGIFRSVFNDKSYSIFNVTCDTSASYKEMNDIKVPLEDESSIKIRCRRLLL